jgi:hypothetical protein
MEDDDEGKSEPDEGEVVKIYEQAEKDESSEAKPKKDDHQSLPAAGRAIFLKNSATGCRHRDGQMAG